MLDSELLKIIDRYLARAISLEELEDWLVPRLPALFRMRFSTISDLVAEIEAGLAELSDQMRTEEEFRHLLKNCIQQVQAVWANYPTEDRMTYTESSNQASPTLQYTTLGLVGVPA